MRSDLRDRQSLPLGELLIHQLAHYPKGDRQLVGMHLHRRSITRLDLDRNCFPSFRSHASRVTTRGQWRVREPMLGRTRRCVLIEVGADVSGRLGIDQGLQRLHGWLHLGLQNRKEAASNFSETASDLLFFPSG